MATMTQSSTLVMLIGIALVVNCGGEAQADAQRGASGGHGGTAQHAGGRNAGGEAGIEPGPATHVAECETLCARTADAGCSAGSEECVLVCATVTGFANCQPKIDGWLSCAQSSPIACDASGAPTFSDCASQLDLALLCAASTEPPKLVQQSCESYCNGVEAAGCSPTNPLGDCRQACGLAGMVISDCQSKFVGYLDCLVASGQSCGADGALNTSICLSQQFAYSGCMLASMGTASELGGIGGTGAQ